LSNNNNNNKKKNKKNKCKSYGKYRSGLEKALAKQLPSEFEYEPFRIPYVINKKYCPDFVFGKFLIECKGFFRVGDTQKYKAIRDYLTDYELIFVWSDPNKKIRKGSKLTLGGWCDKENIKHYTVAEAKELIKYVYSV